METEDEGALGNPVNVGALGNPVNMGALGNPVNVGASAQVVNGAYNMDGIKDELQYLDDIPKAIIFTNLPDAVFDTSEPNFVKVERGLSYHIVNSDINQ